MAIAVRGTPVAGSAWRAPDGSAVTDIPVPLSARLPLRHGKPSPAQPRHGGTRPVPAGGRFPASGCGGPGHHQPWRCAQTSIATDIADMNDQQPTSQLMCVLSLTMTFMPMIDDTAVTGRVTAAITARRSAAIVIFVLVRVW